MWYILSMANNPIPELVELLPPYLCLSTTVNVWVVVGKNQHGLAKLVNAENDVVFWAPFNRLAPVQIR